MDNQLLEYFNGDTMAASVWADKYQMKDTNGNAVETTPADMHRRLANEFARVEYGYIEKEFEAVQITEKIDEYSTTTHFNKIGELSPFGQQLLNKRVHQSEQDIADELFSYFDHFKQIVPQGSIMSNLGNKYVFASLSNCFGIAPPNDSYAGICRTDQELLQVNKRRGGGGTHLSNLRFKNAAVSNAAKSSSGVVSFAERYSNSTREVAQEGRRGALMLLLHVQHPEIFDFVRAKKDRTKITGANISVMLTDEFMQAVRNDADFICRFPVNFDINPKADYSSFQYNKIYTERNATTSISFMKIHAKELFDLIQETAWECAEPGVAYIDNILNYSPDAVYDAYRPIVCNPCAEQWFSADETCRLIALNFMGAVDKPFQKDASIDLEKLYEISYIQQRLGDNLVDLEAEYIDIILNKLFKDIQDKDAQTIDEAQVEIKLWQRIKKKAIEGRRTGGGFTALGDMLAAVGLAYDNSTETLDAINLIARTKMMAELDASIDMAILRGAFTGWDKNKEYLSNKGANKFFDMILYEFPKQAQRMSVYGRRNVSWSNVSPTGTVSLMTQTTSGLEPLFKAYHFRKIKVNDNRVNTRVDFVDAKGDKWMEYPVLHPKFKEWILAQHAFEYKSDNGFNGYVHPTEILNYIENLGDKQWLKTTFEASPWYNSEANDIPHDTRIAINAIIQKYTSNAISCTVNLPRNVRKEVIGELYMKAWEAGLKGLTVYRDGSRDAVLITESVNHVTTNTFGYTKPVKRPESLDAHFHSLEHAGERYAVIVGLLDGNPYEVFTYKGTMHKYSMDGKVIKKDKGYYKFESNGFDIDNLVPVAHEANQSLLTRWVSMMLRHGAEPKYIVEQIEKAEVQVGHFSKVIARVLKKYIPEEVLVGEECPNCKSRGTMIYQEGCKSCSSCGHSKC